MTEEFPVIPALAIDARPARRNARPNYPWSRLEPGEGFYFKAGTSILHARNQASMFGTQLSRQFQVRISLDSDELMCVRNDGLMYDPEIGPHGERSRPTTQRMVWYPRDESPEAYRERMSKDALVDELKPLMDHYTVDGARSLVRDIEAALMQGIARAAEEASEQPPEGAGKGASDTPDLI